MNPARWLIIELSEFGEETTYPELIAAITLVFGEKTDYFVPTHYEKIGSYTATNKLFDGYAFVKDSEETRKRLANLSESRVFAKVLKRNGQFQTLSTREIESLKKKLKMSMKKKLAPGLHVKILDGIFKNMEGEIQSMDGQTAIVNIKCVSREIIAPVPVTCVEKIS